MDISTKSAFCFLLWSLLLIQWYFSFYYAYFSSTPIFQWTLGFIVLTSSIFYSQQIFQQYINPTNKILWMSLFFTLLISHIRILYTHFVVDFKPYAYWKDHGVFLLCLCILLTLSFIPRKSLEFPVWVPFGFLFFTAVFILLKK